MTAASPSEFLADDAGFGDAWNQLDRPERLRLRRLVRMGRAIDDPMLESLAGAYARHQLARPWMRLFWFWFVPGVVLALGIASQIHPLALGVVLALAGQAVWAQINLKRSARATT